MEPTRIVNPLIEWRRRGGRGRMIGIDPEGCDLRRDGSVARLEFGQPVLKPAASREDLVRLAKSVRAEGSADAG